MKRKIVRIDEDKCTGCGLCAEACHEGAIAMADGKAHLVRDDYCDGLGDCLPACPAGAITIEEREATAYDAQAVNDAKSKRIAELLSSNSLCFSAETSPSAVPFSEDPSAPVSSPVASAPAASSPVATSAETPSQLAQWPCQIKLVPTSAPYFADADLLIAADCCAYAFADFHCSFMASRVTLIGCPKLDMVDYSDKLTEILRSNSIRSVTVVRMDVPCCGGLENAARRAVVRSGKSLPAQCVTIGRDGSLLARDELVFDFAAQAKAD
jgi:Fe-S-cluster-containing hydrogenase component 2